MILDGSDPSGKGLFSKCARNHASRLKPHYRPAAPASHGILIKHKQKLKQSSSGFQHQVSREQREQMFMTSHVPPVGHYHPVIKKEPKMIWDILRAYHHRSSKREVPQPPSASPHQHSALKIIPSGKQTVAPLENLDISEGTLVHDITAIGNYEKEVEQTRQKCMVNMSRMKGRKEDVVQSGDWGDINIMKPIQYVKGTICKNIDFGGRRMQRVKGNGKINNSSYDYDYRVIRPQQRGQLDFGVGRGRTSGKVKTEQSNSYQHYDYDAYVWQSNSNVYPNTRTHMVEFKRQTNRYHRIEQPDRL